MYSKDKVVSALVTTRIFQGFIAMSKWQEVFGLAFERSWSSTGQPPEGTLQ